MFNFEFDIRQFYVTIMTTIAAGVALLIRKIFTSERKIALLESTLKNLTDSREEHDERVDNQLKEIRHDIKNLLSRKSIP